MKKLWISTMCLLAVWLGIGTFTHPGSATGYAQLAPTATPVISIPLDAHRLQFERGTTFLAVENESLAPHQTLNFVLAAMRDQWMRVEVWPLSTQDPTINLTIVGSATGEVLVSEFPIDPHLGQVGWDGVLPATQDYLIQITNQGPSTSVRLHVSIPARIQLAPGATSTTIAGHLPTLEFSNAYLLWANEGQQLILHVNAPDDCVFMSVIDPSGNPIHRWEIAGSHHFDWTLQQTGDYLISVISFYQVPVDYTLGVTFPASGDSAQNISPTSTPVPYSACTWQWAYEDLPELSIEVQTAFVEAGITTGAVKAYAFGENCLDAQTNQIHYFAPKETDFQVTLLVDDLADQTALGILVHDVLIVLNTFDPDSTPGPQPGRYELTFQTDIDSMVVMVQVTDAIHFEEMELTGATLWETLISP